MTKIKEDETFIYYKFETSVIVDTFRTEKGRLRNKTEIKYGYCKFNKKTEDFELDQEKTYSYFLQESNPIAEIAQVLLLYYKIRNLDFPDKISRAYG